jgi:CheY-like chemotaxis protein
MPGINGIELIRKLSIAEPAKSAVLMISAAEWAAVEKDAKNAGVIKFLAKPVFPSVIADVIKECLEGSGQEKKREESDQQTEKDNFESYTMLLAEDIEINREIILTILEPTAMKIDCAENGREAVEKYTASPEKYDLILMDLQMPEMDGYEAARRIREFERENIRKPVPIVAMTANVFMEDIERCLSAGMNDHVGKPLDIKELLQKLRKYLLA